MARTKQTARKNTDGNSVRKELAKKAASTPRSIKKLIDRVFLCQLEGRDLARVIEVGLYSKGVSTDRSYNYEYAKRYLDGGLCGSVIESNPEHWCIWFTTYPRWSKKTGVATLAILRTCMDSGVKREFVDKSRWAEYLDKPLPLSLFALPESETDAE
jgi:hypothetical protein